MTWNKSRKSPIQSWINPFEPDTQRIISKVANEIVDDMWENPKLIDNWLKQSQPSKSDTVQNRPLNAYMIENQPGNADPYWHANSALTNKYYRISGCKLRSVNMTVPGTVSQCLKRCLVINCPTLAVKYNSYMCTISLSYSYTNTNANNIMCYQRKKIAGYQIQRGKTCKWNSQPRYLIYQYVHVCARECTGYREKCRYFVYSLRQDGFIECMFFPGCRRIKSRSKDPSLTTTIYKKQ